MNSSTEMANLYIIYMYFIVHIYLKILYNYVYAVIMLIIY